MKKFLALALALMMVLCCFVACDTDDDDDSDKKSSKKSSSNDDYAYSEAIENYIDARCGDFDAYKAMAPDEYWDVLEDEGYDIEDAFDQMTSVEIDDVEVEIIDEDKLDTDDIEEFVEEFNMHSLYELDADDISKAYEVEAEITLEMGDSSGLIEGEWVAVKIDGEWYLATEFGSFGV